MFLAPFDTIEAIKAFPEARGKIPPVLTQGVAPEPSTQWSVSDTKLCHGLDVLLAVHINMNPPVLQLSLKKWIKRSIFIQTGLEECDEINKVFSQIITS